MATDPTRHSEIPAAKREPTVSAAKLAVAARRARAEAGANAQMLLAEPIAIVGMGCRFPGGANSPAEYWRLLVEGRSGIRVLPEGRWAGARETLAPHLLVGGYLEDVEMFDAEFFGIAPREAHSIDPQQRLLLEVVWEALADAGVAPSALSGSETGVFVAEYANDYARMQMADGASLDSHTGVGSAHSVSAGRISFLLNLRGPCMAVDTACSSSLVAAHLACQSLRSRECHVALVGGCSLKLLADEVRTFAQWGMLASDGQAKTFDARADGFAPGEGCGVLVLKRLSDAVAQGDRIHAVIRGAAVNHDGRSSVLTAPNGPAQEAVIRLALKDGQLGPEDVSYVEAHGTGTSLGDPIEVEALDAVYGASGVGAAECVLGAVKTNFGHLEAAAGLAGLIKVVLCLENQAIPRNLNFETLNPQISIGKSRLRLATESRVWAKSAQPRFAGVSSFGLGGTNAHLILEEAPVMPSMRTKAVSSGEFLLAVSAHTAEGLIAGLRDYAVLLRKPGASLEQVARAAARARDHGDFRVAVTGSSIEEVAGKLEERAEAGASLLAGDGSDRVGFVFSGQGSTWPGMLAALVEQLPEAEKTIAECERLVQKSAGWSLRAAAASAAELEDTAKAQPVLFAMQMALVKVLASWGIAPEAVTGHSVGEVAAAVCAGVLTLEEGIRLVLRRGARMGAPAAGGEPGRMLSAEMSEADAFALLAGLPSGQGTVKPELAAVNAPKSVVFAGPDSVMQALAGQLVGRGIATRWLDVQYAFHSAAMGAASRGLEADLKGEFGTGARRARPAITLISTVTGEAWSAADGDAAYWARGIRQPVRFRAAVAKVLEAGCRTVVEIGPHPVLLRSVSACAAESFSRDGAVATLATMRRGQAGRATLLAALGSLYERGAQIAWGQVYPGALAHVALPPYRWNRQRYWLTQGPGKRAGEGAGRGFSGWADLPGRDVDSAFVEGRVRETPLGTDGLPWLADHRFQDVPVLPFAAWLELARRAAGGPGTLREFAVHRRLELGAADVMLQTQVMAVGEVKLAALLEGRWEAAASGFWDSPEVDDRGGKIDVAGIKARALETSSSERIYDELAAKGLTYGPAFRLLEKVYAGPGFALGEVAGPQALGGVEAALHPALIDACLQTMQAAREPQHRGLAVLPFSVRSYRVLRGMSEGFAVVDMRPSTDAQVEEADISVVDRKGALVAEILGLRARRVTVAAMRVAKAAAWRMMWESVSERSVAAGSGDASPIRLEGSLEDVSRGLLKAVARERERPASLTRVCFVTRAAVAVFPGERVDPEQAAVWGLARSFRAEYPSVVVMLLDFPGGTAGIGEPAVVDRWMADAGLDSAELACRSGGMYQARLEAALPGPAEHSEVVLQIGTPGLLESLREVEAGTVPALAADQVRIACLAHGLNFRDVLTALGNYAGLAGAMGGECAGVVTEAGPDSGFAPGDAVVAFARDSMRSSVVVAASYVIKKPAGMSFAEAATIPVAFLTAQYGFSRLAELKAGQTVLVHSAAGGLGQAAVQLARRAGATVIATAGSEEKRAYLRTQGLEHVFDSRSESFVDDVLAATGGRGVDVVLNALSGEKIAAGFRALARGGAFLEVGKRDIWSVEQVANVRPDARYWAFDLGDVVGREPGLAATMFAEIFAGFASGELRPLPVELYPMAAAEHAFRFMASGRHIGKLALVRPARPLRAESWQTAIEAGTVLITGGTGALGLATARWLLEQGARSLVLVSRTGKSVAAETLEAEFAGARVLVAAADVTDRDQMEAALDLARGMDASGLRVVIHAAGETADLLLADHSDETLAAGLRVKVDGARLLADLTAEDNLAMTIYYSSAAALLGSAGQAGYAAANADLDGLAERRTATGLPTLSVNWGAWAQGGMVDQLSAGAAARLARQGVTAMRPAAALSALGEAVLSGQPRVVIAEMDWVAYRGQFPGGSAAGGFFEGFLPEADKADATPSAQVEKAKPPSDADEVAAIRVAARSERVPRMEAMVRSAARRVLGLSAGRPMAGDTALQEFGLDSLMALELRNVLAQAMGRPLSATLLFDYPAIRGLAGYLLSLMKLDAKDEVKVEVSAPFVGSLPAGDLLEDDELAEMSDAEAEELLLAELDRKGRN